MRNIRRSILVLASAVALTGLVITGCGQARPEENVKPTEKQSETVPAVTEAPIVIQTEAPTEAPVETEAPVVVPQTEPQTQPATQAPETAAPAPALSAEEELAQEYEYEDWITMWSGDDINVRETPTTDGDNIISSLDKGEAITVIGETVNWYEIYKEYDTVTEVSELVGFVKKEFLYLSEEEALAEHPQQTAPAATPETTAPAEQPAQEPAPAPEAAPAETPQTAAPAAPASSASGPTVTVNADANIRSDASEVAGVIGTVNAGTQVTKIGESGGWIQIDYNGTQGYVNAKFVS